LKISAVLNQAFTILRFV